MVGNGYEYRLVYAILATMIYISDKCLSFLHVYHFSVEMKGTTTGKHDA
jgi:hypothetical protein